MALRHDQGIVLRSFPFGEADRVVVLLSPNRGKIRAVAKGVRKTKSRFGGRLEPFTHVDLVLYEGRNLDTITQAEAIEAFPRLRQDFDKVMAATVMVEILDVASQPDEASHRAFLLLQRSLRALESGPTHPDFVTSFLLKAADVIGVAVALDACAGCGTPDGLHRFAFAAGGVLCDRCRTPGAVVLRDGLTDYLARLAVAPIDDLPDAQRSLKADALGVTRRFLEFHLDRRLMAAVNVE